MAVISQKKKHQQEHLHIDGGSLILFLSSLFSVSIHVISGEQRMRENGDGWTIVERDDGRFDEGLFTSKWSPCLTQ